MGCWSKSYLPRASRFKDAVPSPVSLAHVAASPLEEDLLSVFQGTRHLPVAICAHTRAGAPNLAFSTVTLAEVEGQSALSEAKL